MDNILDPQDTIKSYLELMPENQRDPEALAKKAYHADTHIKTLEMRLDEYRKDLLEKDKESQTRAKLEDLIKQAEAKLASNEQPQVNEVKEKPTLDLNDVDKLLADRLQRHEAEKTQTANAAMVKKKLQERYGDNYSSIVNEQISDMGLSSEDFNALARKSPAALLKTLGVDQVQQNTFVTPPRGNTGFTPKSLPKKTWSYYQALKKENPKLYRDPKITNEMTASMIELGDAFKDGDYGRFGDAVQ